MADSLFGTDGIRGPAGVYPLDSDTLRQIGKAIAAHFASKGELLLIGRDPRESSPALSDAVVGGLVAGGARVENLGVLPTPGLAYLTKQRGARAGVMITASHNPYTDNGIKVFTAEGTKLTDSVQEALNHLIDSDIPDAATGSHTAVPEAVADYRDFLVQSAAGVPLSSLTLALDTANGATSGLAEQVFKQLEATVVPLFDQPDGRNINVECGATDTRALQGTIQERHLSGGAAFDGDGDRVLLADEHGRLLTGDHILYILAVSGQHKGVVATLMSNMGLETALSQYDITVHRTTVGDRYVLEGLEQTGLRLGGEQSGHIILSDYSPTGDGLLAAIRTLVQAQNSGKTLAQWYDELQLLPQALVNIPLHDKSLLQRPEVVVLLGRCSTEIGKHGRLNIRPSGTEPKLRVMVESPDAEARAKAIAEELSALLNSLEQQ